jgi:arylsulfatase B
MLTLINRYYKKLIIFFFCVITFGCNQENELNNNSPNILFIIADDLGVEQIESFGIGTQPASTPNLFKLAQQGMSFSNVWVQPTCSPTRASLLTGRYGFQTGVGVPPSGIETEYPALSRIDGIPTLEEFIGFEKSHKSKEVYETLGPVFEKFSRYYDNSSSSSSVRPTSMGLPTEELTLPELFRQSNKGYVTGAIGKWHLGDQNNGWLEHPSNAGFDYFSVNMQNQPESYFAWFENNNGIIESRTGYTPSQKVDDAINWISLNGDSPWFLWLAFNLPHYPHHVAEVENLDTSGIEPEDSRNTLDTMIARMDQEIGRLLNGIQNELENTVIIFIGDNGTTGEANDPPFHPERGKFTLYEGGLRVPLIITGPGIPSGKISNALVNGTDLFATLAEIADIYIPNFSNLNSVSLVPYFKEPNRNSLRDFVFSDSFYSSRGFEEGGFAIKNNNFKLIRWLNSQELYNLTNDPYEGFNILSDGTTEEELLILENLENIVNRLHAE